jgi:hypothetical protein
MRAAGPHSPDPSLPEGERGIAARRSGPLSFSLLSLRERRAGVVRAFKGMTLRKSLFL